MNRVNEFQSLSFPSCFLIGVVCMDDSLVLEIYSFSYDRVVKKAVFHWFYYLLFSSYSMNSGCFMLLCESILHGKTPDGRFNPHNPFRGSGRQSLSEI